MMKLEVIPRYYHSFLGLLLGVSHRCLKTWIRWKIRGCWNGTANEETKSKDAVTKLNFSLPGDDYCFMFKFVAMVLILPWTDHRFDEAVTRLRT